MEAEAYWPGLGSGAWRSKGIKITALVFRLPRSRLMLHSALLQQYPLCLIWFEHRRCSWRGLLTT